MQRCANTFFHHIFDFVSNSIVVIATVGSRHRNDDVSYSWRNILAKGVYERSNTSVSQRISKPSKSKVVIKKKKINRNHVSFRHLHTNSKRNDQMDTEICVFFYCLFAEIAIDNRTIIHVRWL